MAATLAAVHCRDDITRLETSGDHGDAGAHEEGACHDSRATSSAVVLPAPALAHTT
jgi:hypothetical protein